MSDSKLLAISLCCCICISNHNNSSSGKGDNSKDKSDALARYLCHNGDGYDANDNRNYKKPTEEFIKCRKIYNRKILKKTDSDSLKTKTLVPSIFFLQQITATGNLLELLV